MIATLLKFELKALSRDRAVWLLAVLFAGVVALGTANGLRWVGFQEAALALVRAKEVQGLQEIRAKAGEILRKEKPEPRGWWNNPADVRGFGLGLMTAYAIKPPAPLAALAVGQADVLPYYFSVSAATKRGLNTSYELENPRRLLLGQFDLAFVVIFLAPLFLLALGHNVVAAEKESGLLALLAAQPVGVGRLVAVKLGVRVAVFGLIGLAAVVATLALAGFAFTAPGAGGGLLRWSAVTGAYIAFCFGATALVIARGWNSATNALVLAGAWLVLTVVLPWGLNLGANLLHPLPSRADFILAQRAATDAAFAQRGDLLARYLRSRPTTDTSHLFVGQTELIGRPLSTGAICAVIDRAYKRCGFLHWFGTHRLRHSFATRLYTRGATTKEIADLLGHRLVATTDRYTQTHDLRALVRSWPR